MKFSIKSTIVLAALVVACAEPDAPTPDVSGAAANFQANVMFVNASPDAPSLDLYANNVKVGTSQVFPPSSGANTLAYAATPITSAGFSGGLTANTSIRTKSTSGTIGGVLASNDLIYRAGNNNATNFNAQTGGFYTIIAVDTIKRPVPLRTLNALNFGDVTYYSSKASFTSKKKLDPAADTVITLSVGSNNSIVTANLLKKYNAGNLPSFFIPIGVVPLGSTDVGGVRYFVIADEIPYSTTVIRPTPATGKFAARFFNLSPDAGTVTVTVGGTSLGNGILSFPMTQANFNPTVGSRTLTPSAAQTFSNNFANAGTLDVLVKSGANTIASSLGASFVDGGAYTVFLTGSVVKNTLSVTIIKNK